MKTFLQIAAVIALGLVATWLVNHWNGLFDNSSVSFVLWIALMLAIGFVIDRRRKQKRLRDMRDLPERD